MTTPKLMTKNSVWACTLAVLLGAALVTPSVAAPFETDHDVNIDVLVGGDSVLGETVWFSSTTPKAVTITVQNPAPSSAGDVTSVVFGMEDYNTLPKVFDFSGATGPTPTIAGWASAPTNDGGEVDDDGMRWAPGEAPVGCGLPMQAPCPVNMAQGAQTYTFTVGLAPESASADFAPQAFTVFVNDENGGSSLPLSTFSFGIDVNAPLSSITDAPTLVGPGDLTAGAFQVECTASDAFSGLAGVELFVLAPGGDASDAGDYTPMDVDCADPIDVAAPVSGDYHLFTRATDNALNVQAFPLLPDGATVVQVDLDLPQVTLGFADGQFSPAETSTIDLEVDAQDFPSGLASVLVEFSDDDGASWSPIAAPGLDAEAAFPQTVTVDLEEGLGASAPFATYLLRASAQDNAGNADASDELEYVKQITDHVITTITDVADAWLEVGDSTLIEAKAVYGASEPSAGSAYPMAIVELSRDGLPLGTETANGAGVVYFDVPSTPGPSAHTYSVATLASDLFEEAVVTETGAVAGRTQQVVFTELQVADLASSADAVLKGAPVDVTVGLQWAHDGSPATGVDASSLLATLTGQGGGLDAEGLLPAVPSTASIGDFDVTATPGSYTSEYAHDVYESLLVSASGGSVAYSSGASDPETIFDATASADDIYVHWVGAYVADLALSSDDDAGTTPDFVDLDDAITLEATVVYTPNYDPNDADGLLADGAAPVAIEGATVGLFETSHLDDLYAATPTAPAVNGDSLVDSDTDANGVATLVVGAADFSQAALRGGGNTYGVSLFPTALAGLGTQGVAADNVPSLADTEELTFTALDVALVDKTGVEDDAGRWWLAMDNAKGDVDTDPVDTDALAVDLHATWRHDGSDLGAATLKVHDGTAFLNDGADLTATTDTGGLATITFDPDAFDLDAIVTDLDFQAVSAAEPGSLTESIDLVGSTVEKQVVWTRIALDLAFGAGSDGEVDLAAPGALTLDPVYYHSESTPGDGYYFGAGLLEAVDDVDFTAQVADTTASGLTTAADATEDFDADAPAPMAFTVTGGCADPDGVCSADLAEAGYHTYVASLVTAVVPHGLDVDGDAEDVLYTAVVLATGTDRLTAPVSADITVSGQAFYAHTQDVDGSPLGDLPYTGGLTVDVSDDAASVADDLAATLGAFEQTVTGPALPGHHDLVVDGAVLADDGSASPLTLAYAGATMERVWLALDATQADLTRTVQIRGRDVDASFELSYTDGVAPVTVDDVNEGFAFGTTDVNPDARFSNVLATTPATTAPTVQVTGPGGADFPATYDGLCACWTATLTSFDEVETVDFTTDASLDLTQDSLSDVGTTLAASGGDFAVTFTVVDLQVIESGPAFQADLVEFWYDLGDAGTVTVQATWAHDGSAVTGADVRVEDPDLAGSDLAGVSVDELAGGFYTLTVPSTLASSEIDYAIGLADADSPAAGEDAFTEGTPFTVDADSLVDGLAAPTLVRTQIALAWDVDTDGAFVNRQQGTPFAFATTWEHDDSKVDRRHAWSVDLGGGGDDATFLAIITPGASIAAGRFDITREGSGAVTVSPTVSGLLAAPRGITAVALSDAPTVTWTALDLDIQAPATADHGVPIEIGGRASLEHDAGTYLVGTVMKLAGTAKTTTATGFPGGTAGANVLLTVNSGSSVKVFAEGISHDPGTVLGASAITASDDASATIAL